MTRPDKHNPSSLAFDTQAVHTGNEIDPGTRALRTPIIMANSYALPEDPSGMRWSESDPNLPLNTRNAGVNQRQLQRKLAAPITARELEEAHLANVLRDAHRDDPEFEHRLLADEAAKAGLRACDRRVWRIRRDNRCLSVFGTKRAKNGKRPGLNCHGGGAALMWGQLSVDGGVLGLLGLDHGAA